MWDLLMETDMKHTVISEVLCGIVSSYITGFCLSPYCNLSPYCARVVCLNQHNLRTPSTRSLAVAPQLSHPNLQQRRFRGLALEDLPLGPEVTPSSPAPIQLMGLQRTWF